MKTETKVNAGGSGNHNEALMVKSAVTAGGIIVDERH